MVLLKLVMWIFILFVLAQLGEQFRKFVIRNSKSYKRVKADYKLYEEYDKDINKES